MKRADFLSSMAANRCLWLVEPPKKIILPLGFAGCDETVSYPAGMVRRWDYCPLCGKELRRANKVKKFAEPA